jgi:L-2-hydroxyglutarate oxidase LhgO
MERCDIAVIGAGAVGLAVALELSKIYKNIVVFEKEDSFGRHTSSRNSETVHSGIYYPHESLKARLSIRGNGLLYGFMRGNDVAFNNCGKYIIASSPDEIPEIERLFANGIKNGVPGVRLADGAEIEEREPQVRAVAGVYVPTAGVMNSYELMKRLETLSKENDVLFAYRTCVTGIERKNSAYEIRSNDGYAITADIVVNCAGLFSDEVASLAGIDIESSGYTLSFCKGEYYKSDNVKSMNMLIYPVPSPDGRSLGIHNRLFTDGTVAFGPNAYYLDNNIADYTMNDSNRDEFLYSLSLFMKTDISDIYPYDCGIRPKLQREGEKFRDFVIKNESESGLKNFINLIGIESPGLTSCLAIAEYVSEIII